MNFFTRLSDIVTSNVNAFLDAADDPETTLGLIVIEMEKGVEAARRSATGAITKAKRLKVELSQYEERIVFWKEKAKQSVELCRDDLARRALQRRRELSDLAGALEDEFKQALETAEHLKTTLRALEARLAETIRQQANFQSGHSASSETSADRSTQQSSDDVAADDASQNGLSQDEKAAQLEKEIAAAEAEAMRPSKEAASSADQIDRELNDRQDLETELAALKSDVANNKL